MGVIVYGDFNCPYSYLASQRVDMLRRVGVEVDWRAVEHDPGLSMTGTPSAGAAARSGQNPAAIALPAPPAEHRPDAAPPLVSNTLAAVSAYAEAVTDGVQHEVRRALFDAIWLDGRHLSGAYDVRALVAAITYPPYPIAPYLISPELPPPGYGDPGTLRITRMLGGTVAPNGIPLTTTGWRRVRRWRDDWLAVAGNTVPVAVAPDGAAYRGIQALAYLADLLDGSAGGATPPPAPAALAAV
ncbi:DsbA family oxidoreductase [Rhizomonospora bruguierae]|uniref:DsbA family oxidoreductase n=1 Tax=Rhizomonospora bruguierae TaxID=1581705 RepID=UPI001BCF7ADA|nr:DsbA family protein [Micromonospora sp. NBRC 107566]